MRGLSKITHVHVALHSGQGSMRHGTGGAVREQGSLALVTPLLLSEARQVDGAPPIGMQPSSGLQVRRRPRGAEELP